MPSLSWSEIRQRAIQFSREWRGASEERAEAQTFWNEFFDVFGIRRRTVASFEEPVQSIKKTYHRIDLFWRGRMLAEHKSANEALDKAQSQAFQYIQELAASGREDEIPRYVVLSNFKQVALYDLEPDEQRELPLWRDHKYLCTTFALADLHKHVSHFAFFIGQQTHRFGEDDPANLKAAGIMAGLHDAVKRNNYAPEALERLLVRLLFCLFADDTGIFNTAQFEQFISERTRVDGVDLGAQLSAIFDTLNTPVEIRPRNLDADLADFPYINGELFGTHLPLAGFDRLMRDQLLAACRFDWSRISPAIFGSLFQGILDAKERRQIGAHYTSERDIMKVIRPLFLDELRAEFGRIKTDRSRRREARLHEFQMKLGSLRFLDPACGCGNFLVIAYREIRRLELEILKILYDLERQGQAFKADELAKLSLVDVDRFYGIEIGEWPARIAETALWLTDHQMNTELTLASGNIFQRIPLRAAPHIRCANALTLNWNELLPAEQCAYVLGNPPFVGKQYQTRQQKEDMALVTSRITGARVLDYVACWYIKASDYINGKPVSCAFVSTNSITQGEQVTILWRELLRTGIHINFAHRTFSWQSEARGKAHVHVVIVGFSRQQTSKPKIYDYENLTGEPREIAASQINPYLIDAPVVIVEKLTDPICHVPRMSFGSMPNDGGHLIMTEEEMFQVLRIEPALKGWIKPFVGATELINGYKRYCFWLVGAPPNLLRNSPILSERVKKVREERLKSRRSTTVALADSPALFGEIRQPKVNFIAVPEVSSERRVYLPMVFLTPDTIASNLCHVIPRATAFHFGILASAMHMAWVRQVCGRLKSDYRYSASLVYNNFPWPMDATRESKGKVDECAHRVIDARQPYLDGGSTLADLYDPMTMPGDLLRRHQALDRAVDRCYRAIRFGSERERVEFLFKLYQEVTSPLAPSPEKKSRRRKQQHS